MKIPRDAPKRKVVKTFESLGFGIVRMGKHISMEAVSQLTLTPEIIVLFGFKALFGLLHHSVLNCWTASMVREDPDGTKTPLTMPNHERIKGSTLRVICRQAGIKREDFLTVYERI